MENKIDTLLEMDYVYVPEGSSEYMSVRVTLKIPDDTLEMYITSDENIATSDLVEIIRSLQKTQFDKHKINIIQDGKVFLCMQGKNYALGFAGQSLEKLDLGGV